MKKAIFLCLVIVLFSSGCSKVSYSSEFPGIPIYPGTELTLSNEFENQVSESYVRMYFKGDIEDVKVFFEKNIDKDIWTVEVSKQPFTGHNVDKIYGYNLNSKDGNATLTMAYTNSDKVGEYIRISIVGDKVK